MNISAKFICRRFSPRFHAILPYCDFIFGNEAEAEAYAVHNGLGKGLPLEQIAQKMASYEKINSNRPRCVIITQVISIYRYTLYRSLWSPCIKCSIYLVRRESKRSCVKMDGLESKCMVKTTESQPSFHTLPQDRLLFARPPIFTCRHYCMQ